MAGLKSSSLRFGKDLVLFCMGKIHGHERDMTSG